MMIQQNLIFSKLNFRAPFSAGRFCGSRNMLGGKMMIQHNFLLFQKLLPRKFGMAGILASL